MTKEEIDKVCELCMQDNCTGCEFQDVHFRNVPWYKKHKVDMTNNKIEKSAAKDEALKIATKMLSKLYHSDNNNADAISLQACLLTAEADKDYGKMYSMLEELRKFIVKLQESLKQNK